MAKTKKNSGGQEPLISETEVWDVLKFAGSLYGNVYNPMLVSERLKEITMSPAVASIDLVNTALSAPTEHEDQLLGYSEYFQLTSMLYQRVLRYMSSMLSFDWTMVCTNASGEDYTSRAYKRDEVTVFEFFDKFDVKSQFKTVMNQLLRQETFFSVLRDEGDKWVLQELPSAYCKITGRWDYGLLFDFNMYWFWRPGVSLDMYPEVFKKLYARSLGRREGVQPYEPATSVDNRTGAWIYWVQTDPADGFWSWKFTPEIATRVPFLAPMFPDVVLQPTIRALQTNAYMAAASKMLVGEVPLLGKDVKGATVKDAVALTPDTLGKFLAVLKGALSEVIKVGAAPLENINGISFPLEGEFYKNYMQSTTASSGINSRLLFTIDRSNAVETLLSVDVDEYLLKPIYSTFESFLNYQVNKLTKKYKFKFKFEGTEFHTNRKERFEQAKELAALGIVLPQKFAASLGMQYSDFVRQLEEGRMSGFVQKLTPIQTTYQLPKEGAGRPAQDTTEIDDEGETDSNASNLSRGGEKMV